MSCTEPSAPSHFLSIHIHNNPLRSAGYSAWSDGGHVRDSGTSEENLRDLGQGKWLRVRDLNSGTSEYEAQISLIHYNASGLVSLFNDAVKTWSNVALKSRVTEGDKLERMWKRIVLYISVYFPSSEKVNKGSWDHIAVCVSLSLYGVCVSNSWKPE